ELVTCAVEGFPIKIALINNGNLGMVRQWQTLFYDGHYSHTNLKPKETYLPDFLQLAESMGCAAFRVEKEEEVLPTIKKAREINDRPVVIDFIVGEDAQVWPMVPAGTSNDEVQYARDLRPLFDDEESAAETPAEIHETMQEFQDSEVDNIDAQEGEELMSNLHTLSVLTQDEDGIISRISGMFTRRAFNIVSISSGRTEIDGVNRITLVV